MPSQSNKGIERLKGRVAYSSSCYVTLLPHEFYGFTTVLTCCNKEVNFQVNEKSNRCFSIHQGTNKLSFNTAFKYIENWYCICKIQHFNTLTADRIENLAITFILRGNKRRYLVESEYTFWF